MSINKIPKCVISYPKDLSKLILNFNPYQFQEVVTTFSQHTNFNISITITPLPVDTNTTVLNVISGDYINDIKKVLTGSGFSLNGNNILSGTGTKFTEELLIGDVISFWDNANKRKVVVEIEAIDDNFTAYFNAYIDGIYSFVTGEATRVRGTLEFPASILISGDTELTDGSYNISVFSQLTPGGGSCTDSFYGYVYANIYQCVEKAIFNLVGNCETCPDINTIKNTLMLKGLLDAFEISIRDSGNITINDALSGSEITINQIIEKINRYCKLLNLNCSSC